MRTGIPRSKTAIIRRQFAGGEGCVELTPYQEGSSGWGITLNKSNLSDTGNVSGALGVVFGGIGGGILTLAPLAGAALSVTTETGAIVGLTALGATGVALFTFGSALAILGALALLGSYLIVGSSFSANIDPNGAVTNTNGVPVAGATAVLEQGPTADGPFRPAHPASPGITPHRNLEKTGSDGQFHWDVIRDYYEVVASAKVVVRFGVKAVTRFTVANDNAIEVTATPSRPGTLDVTVTTPVGTTAIDPADRYSYRVSPPKRVPVRHRH